MLKEKKIPAWTEIVLVPKTGKPSLYPALLLFTTPCRLMRPVQNLSVGRQELIGTFEQVWGDGDSAKVAGKARNQSKICLNPCSST